MSLLCRIPVWLVSCFRSTYHNSTG